MWNYELGIEKRLTHILTLDISGFVSDGDNLIRTGGAWPNLLLSNSGAFSHRGVELETKLDLLSNFYVHLTGTWLDPEDDTQASPGRKYGGSVYYDSGRLLLRASAESVSKLYGSNYSRNRLDDYTIADFYVSFRINRYLAINGEAKNLFDKSYAIISGFPLPGRTLFLGLSAGVENR